MKFIKFIIHYFIPCIILSILILQGIFPTLPQSVRTSVLYCFPLENLYTHQEAKICIWFIFLKRCSLVMHHVSGEIPHKRDWKQEGFILVHSLKGDSQSQSGRRGSRSVKWLITEHLWSKSREGYAGTLLTVSCVLAWDSSLWDGNTQVHRESSILIYVFWKHPVIGRHALVKTSHPLLF